ncbi:MAG TPA: hypothetical protein ENK57_24315 [Polyangiaceae bacterium]|nr:hypothetical protein [Polyangiaceae bacterium]
MTWVRACFGMAVLLLGACGDSDPPEPSVGQKNGGGAAPECDSTQGMIAGSVYYFGLPGTSYSEPAPGSLVRLRRSAEDDPVFVGTQDDATFEVTVEAGEWLIGAEDGSGCTTAGDEPVSAPSCETVVVDLVMDCFG